MNLKHDEEYLHKYAEHEAHKIRLSKEIYVGIHQSVIECKKYLEHMNRFIPASEWHDDDGDVLWYRLPVAEPPYVGSPLDVGWDDEPFAILLNGETRAEYFTHFQHIYTPEH